MTSSTEQIKHLIEHSNELIIFNGFISDWKILGWTLKDWEMKLGNTQLQFRKISFVNSETPLWERTCETVHMTMTDFINFQMESPNDACLYFDYKYMNEWFKQHEDILNDISWKSFGYPEKSGFDSTIWIGTRGAHTPCHMDTYGCNLIAQIYGRKQWIIFEPQENLKPTRVPYEESSVYSRLNFFNPDINQFKGIKNARTITLNPGEVLFLPPRWWHYVENTDTAISVNTWIPLPEDNRKRVEEAVTQLLVSQLTKELTIDEKMAILNPNSNDVLEMPLTTSLGILGNVIDINRKEISYKKRKTDNEYVKPDKKLIDIKTIFKENTNIKNVPKLSEQEFENLIKDQKNKYIKNIKKDSATQLKSENVIMVEKIINAICHPEILSAIADKLMND